MSHSDFTLPGLSSRGLSSWIVAISFAYSGRWNSRRLENHFHSFWNFVLLDLVDDLAPDVIVIPQFQFDIIDNSPLAPDTSKATTTQADAKELTPDFSIAVLDVVRRHISDALPTPPLYPEDFNLWRDVQVNMMKVSLIAELKRPPSRRAKSRNVFLEDLLTRMLSAQKDLDKQVEHAFIMQPSVDEILLVACCGEWWSWMISTRAHIQDVNLPQDVATPADEDELEEEVDDDFLELRTRENLPRLAKMHPKGRYREAHSPPPPSESDKIPYNPRSQADSEAADDEGEPERKERKGDNFIRYTELEEGTMEYVKPNIEDALPPSDEWTLPILFGSEASAQHFFLIHRFLEAERLMPSPENQVSTVSLYPYSTLDINLFDFDFGRGIMMIPMHLELMIICKIDLRRRKKRMRRGMRMRMGMGKTKTKRKTRKRGGRGKRTGTREAESDL
jgi:hypothetical protein